MTEHTLPALLRPDQGRFSASPPPSPGDTWEALAGELRHPDLELDPETFAAVAAAFHRRRRSGVPVDPVFAALMTLLTRQVALSGDDVDMSRDLEPLGGGR